MGSREAEEDWIPTNAEGSGMTQPRIFKDPEDLQAFVREQYAVLPQLLHIVPLQTDEYAATRYTYDNGMIVDGVDGGWLWYAPPEEG